MTRKEAAIYQLKQLKGKPFKTKIAHILTYYWVPIAIIIAALVFVITMVIHYASQKETALSICCINTLADSGQIQEYLDAFADARGIDLNEYELIARENLTMHDSEMDISYQNAQLLYGMMATGSLDIMAADKDTILRYAYQETFADLHQLLSPSTLELLEPYLVYMDRNYLPELNNISDQPRQYPDSADPNSMKEPIAVAILLPAYWESTKILCPTFEGDAAIGLVENANNAQNALNFLLYVLEQEGL